MEVQEAIGTRRTFRFLLPHKPVELKQAKMIQRPSPLPWREAELQYLQKALDLPDF
jgi:hypothetical protein